MNNTIKILKGRGGGGGTGPPGSAPESSPECYLESNNKILNCLPYLKGHAVVAIP